MPTLAPRECLNSSFVMKIVIIAGEVSGDQLAASLLLELKKIYPSAEFLGVGGEHLTRVGMRLLASIERLSVHGLIEVLPKLPSILRFRAQLRAQIVAEKPDLIIGVDAPEFNLGLLSKLRAQGFPTVQFVCPSIWAWRANRIHTLKKAVDAVLTLYPFEQELLSQHGITSVCVGHPLARSIAMEDYTERTRELMRIPNDDVVVTLLPGSRLSEVKQHTALIMQTAQLILHRWHSSNPRQSIRFVVPLATKATYEAFQLLQYQWERKQARTAIPPLQLLRGHAHHAIAMSDFCLAASGTVSLEIALYHKPMVIFYRMNPLSLALLRRMYRLPWFGLPNILTQQHLVTELLQENANAENLTSAFFDLWNNPSKQLQLRQSLKELHQRLNQPFEERLREALQLIKVN